MSERQPPRRLTDDELIKQTLRSWELTNRSSAISDSIARLIASQHHGGQDSRLYSFVSTGAIDTAALGAELDATYRECDKGDELALEALAFYIGATGNRSPVDDWHLHALWDEGDDPIGVKFRHHTDTQLARRIERSEPFKNDDEVVELNRRLGRVGLTWMYDRDTRSRVVVIPLSEVGE